MFQYFSCRFEGQRWKVLRTEEANCISVIFGLDLSPSNLASIDNENACTARVLARVQDVDQLTNADSQSSLLEALARRSGAGVLARVNETCRQCPLPLTGNVHAPHKQDLAVSLYQDTHCNLGIFQVNVSTIGAHGTQPPKGFSFFKALSAFHAETDRGGIARHLRRVQSMREANTRALIPKKISLAQSPMRQ